MRIYVASSWRNVYQPRVVELLRAEGFVVYDFRNPAPGEHGFHWPDVDPGWMAWEPAAFRKALTHPAAVSGFSLDSGAVAACEACVLVLPCGRSAHLEAGVAVGSGKPLVVFMPERCEPELMYSWAHSIVCSPLELVSALHWIEEEAR